MFNKKERVLPVILLIYLLCFMLRALEYFILRTDQTFWGEAFVHKLAGIAVIGIAAKIYGLSYEEVGFTKHGILSNILKGLFFGISVFIPAYLTEVIINSIQGKSVTLDLYVSTYAIDGNIGNQTAAIFFVICIAGNIINVIMEEGIFRGLLPRILEKKYSFITAAVIASFLFGIWHIMAPIRMYYDSTISQAEFIINAAILVSASCLAGFKFAMITNLTGSLYMAMGDHFVNNMISNILHVISDTGADELMTARISIAQSASFIVVLIWYVIYAKKNKPINE